MTTTYAQWTRDCLEPEDSDEPGVTLSDFAGAIQIWVMCQQTRPVTVAEAARVFNCPADLVVEAVEWSPWMFLSGSGAIDDRHIELDGE